MTDPIKKSNTDAYSSPFRRYHQSVRILNTLVFLLQLHLAFNQHQANKFNAEMTLSVLLLGLSVLKEKLVRRNMARIFHHLLIPNVECTYITIK